jgi:hypothetical protein
MIVVGVGAMRGSLSQLWRHLNTGTIAAVILKMTEDCAWDSDAEGGKVAMRFVLVFCYPMTPPPSPCHAPLAII